MPVATTPILQKQQNKRPTSMRYERVQDILEKDSALSPLLSPKNQPIGSRFGEKINFSKEAITVTEAIHAEGKDAHKVPKNDVLRIAMRVMKFVPGNGEVRQLLQPAPAPAPEPAAPPAQKKKPVIKKQAEAVETKEDSRPVQSTKTKKKPEPKAPLQPVVEKPKKPAKTGKTQPEANDEAADNTQESLPESELPPEKQPLRLPPTFDPGKWPHYDVQNSVYCLLLSALNLSEHFEKFPGAEERQKKLELLLKDYLATCDAIKIAS